MINEKNIIEPFRWGPIDGKPLYLDAFMRAFLAYPQRSKVSWPDLLGCFFDGKILYTGDFGKIRERGSDIFVRYLDDEKGLMKEYFGWKSSVARLEPFFRKKGSWIAAENLSTLLAAFDSAFLDFWARGFLPELANWGGEKIFQYIIEKKYPKKSSMLVNALLAPAQPTFYEEEEMDLYRAVLGRRDFKAHQAKYYWIKNHYGRVLMLDRHFFKRRMQMSASAAKLKLRKIISHQKKIRDRKRRLRRELDIPREIMKMADFISFLMAWQDQRKKHVFRSLAYLSAVTEAIAEKNGISHEEILQCTVPEILIYLHTGVFPEISSRKKAYCMNFKEKTLEIEYLLGKKAETLIRLQMDKPRQQEMLKGTVVSIPGSERYVKGRAVVLDSSEYAGRIEKDSILVAAMTSPDYIFAMKQAKGIITDVGGMTSHAAVVSREIGKPCIVGTGNATKIIKTGMRVTMDLKTGEIRR